MKRIHSTLTRFTLHLLVFAATATSQSFQPLDFPGAIGTQAWGINSHGEIVGYYTNSDTTTHGFLLKGGQFQTIDFPGATTTQVFGINPQGDISGVYTAAGVTHGFLLSGGRFSTIDPPGSTRSGGAGVNASGDIVGDCLINGIQSGFVLRGSQYEIVDYPDSPSGFVNSINARGDITGNYTVNSVTRGYLRSGGKFSSIEYPAAVFTGAYGINSAAEIVGRYRDSASLTHGFLLINGEYTSFDYPGATFTAGNAIAANGDVVGRFQNSDGVNHAYLYSRASRPQYKVTDLGTLGGSASIAYGMNAAGAVVGAANLPSQLQHAFITRDGKLVDMGTLGGKNSAATNPNGAGLVTVIAETKPDPAGEDFCGWDSKQSCLTAVWKDGKLTALPTLGGNNSLGFVMNERGQTAGASETTTRDSTCALPQVFRFLPVIWDAIALRVQALPLPVGDTVGVAIGINDRGDAVGTTGTCDGTTVSAIGLMFGPHAVLWRNGVPTQLWEGVAASINSRGEIVGGSPVTPETVHGIFWTAEAGLRDLGTIGNDASSFPTMINNSGQITGASCDNEGNCRAFLWDMTTTTMVDLNDLVAGGSGLYLAFPSWITDAGDIVGQAVDMKTGDPHAFLAIPVRGGSINGMASTAPVHKSVTEGLRRPRGASAKRLSH